MSSTPFSTELSPEPRLRRIVLASGALLAAAGILVVISLPVAPHWRWPGGLLWGLAALREIHVIAGGYKRYCRIRIDASGAVRLRRADGGWMPAELQAGSVVLPTLAWLRFRLPGGARCAELLRGNMRDNEAWRRLQLIWRHLGGAR